MIERGRWSKITQENRLCTECLVLEDEYHVICVCTRYTEMRIKYVKPYYINRPCMVKFIQLLNSENVSEMRKLGSFIKSLFNCYNTYLFT